jgi:hypothetical protein
VRLQGNGNQNHKIPYALPSLVNQATETEALHKAKKAEARKKLILQNSCLMFSPNPLLDRIAVR